jgi:hypothetical protein
MSMRFLEVDSMAWRALVVSLLLLAGLLVSPEAALSIEFRKVADMNTAMPGGAGNFEGLDFPSLDAGSVVFGGWNATAVGVYREVGGGFEIVADLTSPVPGRTSTFSSFHDVSQDGGMIGFYAYTSGDPQSEKGIYASSGGSLFVIVDETTHFPEQPSPSATYYRFHSPLVDAGAVYFYGQRGTDKGIHRNESGTIDIVFDADVQMPGGVSDLDSFRFAAGDGGVAFEGNGMWGEEGVYRVLPGSLEIVADWMTPVPDGPDLFTDFSWGVAVQGGRVVFTAGGSSSHGIYEYESGTLSTLVDRNTAVPGSPTVSFDGFGFVSLDGDDTAFEAYLSDGVDVREALYVELDGQLRRVIGTSDTLDGKVVTSLLLGPEALDGNELAFLAHFGGFDYGIYVATIPLAPAPVPALSPLGFAVLGGALLVLGCRARARCAEASG